MAAWGTFPGPWDAKGSKTSAFPWPGNALDALDGSELPGNHGAAVGPWEGQGCLMQSFAINKEADAFLWPTVGSVQQSHVL